MKMRILVGILLTLVLFSVIAFGGYVFLTTITLFAIAAVFEMGRVIRQKGYNPVMAPIYIFAASFAFIYHFFGAGAMLIVFVNCVIAAITASLLAKNSNAGDAITTLFLFVYPMLLLVCMMLVYCQFERPLALTASCLALATPECADAFAYFGGTLFGKRKLCPEISPKKTVEGSLSALVGAVVFGLVLIPLQNLWNGPVDWYVILLLAFACGFFSQIGDLFASYIKRWAGIKDFSSVFPGHGGIMDRIDSILTCAPIVLCCLTILQEVGIY